MEKERNHFIGALREDAIIHTSGKRTTRAGQEEAEHVLPCSDPGGCVAYLAMEINGAEFAEYPVTLAAVLSGFSARSLAHLLFLLTGSVERAARARKSRTGVHFGPGNTILQERMIAPRGNEQTASMAAASRPSPYESSRSPLEKRREELERGAGGDHDLPYRFILPTSLPQVLAWVKLLARVQQGDLPGEVVACGNSVAQGTYWFATRVSKTQGVKLP